MQGKLTTKSFTIFFSVISHSFSSFISERDREIKTEKRGKEPEKRAREPESQRESKEINRQTQREAGRDQEPQKELLFDD